MLITECFINLRLGSLCMKYLNIKIFSVLLFTLMAFTARAELIITPAGCQSAYDDTATPTEYECWTLNDAPPASQPSAAEVSALIGSDVIQSYKSDSSEAGGLGSDTGPFAGNYSATFSNGNADSLLEWLGGDYVDCFTGDAECYVSVKDGSHNPYFYIYNLTDIWDGMMDISFESFWPGAGAISNVAIWTGNCTVDCEPPPPPPPTGCGGPGEEPCPPLPEPHTLLILSTGLLGLYIHRRKRVS